MIIGSALNNDPIEGTKSAEASAKLEDDLNRFLNILVTQLQNQDPLDPLDANEFTSQLVQFASVEQQIYQNSNLEKIRDFSEQLKKSKNSKKRGYNNGEETGKKEQEKEDTLNESKTLLNLLEYIAELDKLLQIINSRRTQYTKG